jgi:deoxyribodipyrimidine photolyase-related protein
VTTIRLVLGDQLTRSVSSLKDLPLADPSQVVLMVEVQAEATYVPHHRQKVAFILSAMRHFAEMLRAEGVVVDYVRLDDPANTGTFTGEVTRAVTRHDATRLVVTEAGEWRVHQMVESWETSLGIPVEVREDDRFIASRARFGQWAIDRKTYRMEFFYREMRRDTGILMDGADPVGGQWNLDSENRRALPSRHPVPARVRPDPDPTTLEVIGLVAARFPDGFGDLEPFGWAVTREAALAILDDFLRTCLPSFGDYQDAMRHGAPFLFHATVSPYLNVGLLLPREVCEAAEAEYRAGRAPLNAVEGFVRQVLGWREYIRGMYWHLGPDYHATNALGAIRPLPAFYWTAETPMRCLADTVTQVRRHAYAHHIQRLMVTGNFAMLAGVRPAEVEAWYLAVFADAFEWVELPNTHGMATWADGGIIASKPYAASGAYIDRMSDYCGGCRYDVKAKSGPTACPFNYLYWAFLIRNTELLSSNPRMAIAYRTLASWTAERRAAIVAEADAFLDSLA